MSVSRETSGKPDRTKEPKKAAKRRGSHDYSAAARKGWASRKAMGHSRAIEATSCGPGYGPDGPKRGSEQHKVKSFAEILARLKPHSPDASGPGSSSLPASGPDGGEPSPHRRPEALGR